MSLPKLLTFLSLTLFGVIGALAFFKESIVSAPNVAAQAPVEIALDQENQTVEPALAATHIEISTTEKKLRSVFELPDANRIEELFNKNDPKLPIVETITYKSHVAWLKGRPAWLSDYASHYETSRHFIARSLNAKPDYNKQDLAEGDQFNVLRQDKNIEFRLIVDTSRCRLWFYYVDLDEKQKVLIKTYQVGLGRIDAGKTSGLLTPLGKYTLGKRVAIYKPKIMGTHHGDRVEMMTVFGTRWIPFEKEIGACTAPAKSFGIHGTPWTKNEKGELVDSAAGIGKYESDGCIRLATEDIEEIFAIIITKPATIRIVRDISEVFDET